MTHVKQIFHLQVKYEHINNQAQMLPDVDRFRGRREREDTACVCSFAFLLFHHHHLMLRKRSSWSSERTLLHHHHHHYLPRPLALRGVDTVDIHEVCQALQCGSVSVKQTLTLLQLLLDQWEKLGGLRMIWFMDEDWREERSVSSG